MASTFVLLKPDAMERGLAGEIITRFETRGLKITAAKIIHIDSELARTHYLEHVEKDFYPQLETFIIRSPSMALVLEATEGTDTEDATTEDIVKLVRDIMGATNPKEAEVGTIRGDLAEEVTENLVHGSDSKVSAEREINLFFGS